MFNLSLSLSAVARISLYLALSIINWLLAYDQFVFYRQRNMIMAGDLLSIRCLSAEVGLVGGPKLGFLKVPASNCLFKRERSSFLAPIMAMEESKVSYVNGKPDFVRELDKADHKELVEDSKGKSMQQMYSPGNSPNIVWHKCSVDKTDRQELLQQKGCVIWITGLSGSGKSTLACALSRGLHNRGKLTYILDGDNVRHGLNRDLSFKADDRAENIRRVGEVGKLFADAGVICIASLISPYRKDRDACRALLSKGEFIEVFMDIPLRVCEARDPKGLYRLARAGKLKGFTGIDDPYEAPLNPEIALQQKEGVCPSPCDMAETVISYLEENGYLVS